MLASIPMRQLVEWMAYSHIEPWDEGRADWRMARLAATISHAAGAKNISEKDFMPDLRDPGERERERLLAIEAQARFQQQIAERRARKLNGGGA